MAARGALVAGLRALAAASAQPTAATLGATAAAACAQSARASACVFARGCAGYAKTNTGLVGLEPEPEWRAKLTAVYEKTLADASTLPDTSGYKKLLVALTQERLAKVAEAADAGSLEDAVGCGQVEQLLSQAEDELKLLGEMMEAKPWEVPSGYSVPVLQFKPGSEADPNFARWARFDWPGPGKP